jgi:drug/metabolite transporter (DMT)-like permease
MIGIGLALLSAAASGVSIVLVKKHSAASSVVKISLVLTVVGIVVIWPLAIAVTDFRMINVSGFLLFAVSGLLSPGIVRLFYYKGLKTLGASVNSSIFAVYPLYTSLLGVLLLNENLTAWNMLGIIVIIVGIVFVEMSINGKNSHVKIGWKSLLAPVLGGLVFGVAILLRKSALDICNLPIFGVALTYVFSLLPYMLILGVSAPTRRELSLTGFPLVLVGRHRSSCKLASCVLCVEL